MDKSILLLTIIFLAIAVIPFVVISIRKEDKQDKENQE